MGKGEVAGGGGRVVVPVGKALRGERGSRSGEGTEGEKGEVVVGKGKVLIGKSRWGRHKGVGEGGSRCGEVVVGKARWGRGSPAFPTKTFPLCLPHQAFPTVPSNSTGE